MKIKVKISSAANSPPIVLESLNRELSGINQDP